MKWRLMIYYCLSKNVYKMKLLNFDKQRTLHREELQ